MAVDTTRDPVAISDDLDEFDAPEIERVQRLLESRMLGVPAAPARIGRDQFAFCVSLWEAITGVRPFAGVTPHAVFDAVLQQVVTAPTRSSMPRWLEPTLRRGLAAAPAARHADMDELLRALTRDPTRGCDGDGRSTIGMSGALENWFDFLYPALAGKLAGVVARASARRRPRRARPRQHSGRLRCGDLRLQRRPRSRGILLDRRRAQRYGDNTRRAARVRRHDVRRDRVRVSGEAG